MTKMGNRCIRDLFWKMFAKDKGERNRMAQAGEPLEVNTDLIPIEEKSKGRIGLEESWPRHSSEKTSSRLMGTPQPEVAG